jgi:membrane fusion protein (multidrug efflux system)
LKPFYARLPTPLASLALLVLAACGHAKKPPPPPPPVVFFTTIAPRDVTLYIEAVGALDGYVNTEIRARVRGYLRTQDYIDGADVKVGQLLFTIEPYEYQAGVSSAKAGVSRALAAQTRDRAQAERYQGLFKTGLVSEQDVVNETAAVAESEGQVRSAKAALEQANLSLSYTQMRSTIDGVAGIAQVRVGNLVGDGEPTLLTTVSQIDPVRVNFPVSEVDYIRNPDRFRVLQGRDVGWAKKQFALMEAGKSAEGGDPGIELQLSDGSIYPHKGVIVTINRAVDASTGTIQLQALVPNPGEVLRPGQFGRVRVRRQDAGHDVIAIPDKALISVQGTYSVAVIGPDNKVQLRRIEVGPGVDGLRIVNKGLAAGDKIVVDGVQRATDGALVDPRPAPGSPGASRD